MASFISSMLLATRSRRQSEATAIARQRARLIATLKRLRESRKEASRSMSQSVRLHIVGRDKQHVVRRQGAFGAVTINHALLEQARDNRRPQAPPPRSAAGFRRGAPAQTQGRQACDWDRRRSVKTWTIAHPPNLAIRMHSQNPEFHLRTSSSGKAPAFPRVCRGPRSQRRAAPAIRERPRLPCRRAARQSTPQRYSKPPRCIGSPSKSKSKSSGAGGGIRAKPRPCASGSSSSTPSPVAALFVCRRACCDNHASVSGAIPVT